MNKPVLRLSAQRRAPIDVIETKEGICFVENNRVIRRVSEWEWALEAINGFVGSGYCPEAGT